MSLVKIVSSGVKSAERCLCVLASKPSSQLLTPQDAINNQPNRKFLPQLPNPFGGNSSGSGKRLEYTERRVLGYSMEQMYSIVAGVEDYSDFVTWCSKSQVFDHKPGQFKCNMTVGFGPLKESYTSQVTVVKPQLVRAECKEGYLFNYLLNNWQFSPGIPGLHQTCTLDFSVAFEFRSSIHSQMSRLFFDQVVKTMVKAFLDRAYEEYGPQSISYSQRKKEVLVYNAT